MLSSQVKSKVNTNIKRSKSSYSKARIAKPNPVDSKYKLDLNKDQRLQEDLKRNVKEETKIGIYHHINNKYADLERELALNMVKYIIFKLKIGSKDSL